MPTIDRRRSSRFLGIFFLSFAVLIGLWIFADALMNLDEFLIGSSTSPELLSDIGRYYSQVLALHYPWCGVPAIAAAMIAGALSSRANHRAGSIA
jgi:hypothetical protein